MNNSRQIRIEDVLRILELPASACTLNPNMNYEQAVEAVDNFKAIVAKQKKVLWKKYHPDIPGNGEEEKNKLQEINNVLDIVKVFKIIKAQPQPVFIHVPFTSKPFGGTSSTTGGTSYYSWR